MSILPFLAPAIIGVQYYLTAIFLKDKAYKSLFGVLLFAMVSYDWVFIEASYVLPKFVLSLTKPYFEYLLVYLLYEIWRKGQVPTLFNPPFRHLFLLVLVPSLATLVLNDLRTYSPAFDLFYGLRLILLPIVFLFLLFKAGTFKNVESGFVLNSLIAVSILCFIAGVIQRLNYEGDVQKLWFYDFMNRFYLNPVKVGWANYVRNGTLRVTGIFVSPITQVLSLGIGILLLAAKLIFQKAPFSKRAFWTLLLVVLLYGQWRTSTRVGLIMDVLGIAVLLGSRLWPRRKAWLYLVPFSAVLATFGTLLSGNVVEESALGRLKQYVESVRVFRLRGLGFSHQFISTYFDSYLITVVLLFGFLAILPLLFIWKLNLSLVRLLRAYPQSVFGNATLAVSTSFLYIFVFQFVAGSFPYRVYFLLLFYCWFAYEQYLKSQNCPTVADCALPTNTL